MNTIRLKVAGKNFLDPSLDLKLSVLVEVKILFRSSINTVNSVNAVNTVHL